MINSDFLNGYTNKKDAIERMLDYLEEKGIRRARCSVQDEGLGVQPSALLGRAYPDRALPEVRHGRRSL